MSTMNFKINKTLSDKIWNNQQLRSDVQKKLIQISYFYLDLLQDVDRNLVEDIHIVGSLCGYNYTKYSDIDVHIIVDLQKVNEDVQMVSKMIKLFSDQFNTKYSITVKGFDVQVNIQNSKHKLHSKGIYSLLKNQWISKPEKYDKIDVDNQLVQNRYDSIVQSIQNNLDNLQNLLKIRQKIKTMRKNGLQQEGQFSVQNIVFKKLRNNKYIKKLKNRIIQLRNQQLTLQKSNLTQWFQIDDYYVKDDKLYSTINQGLYIPVNKNKLSQFMNSILQVLNEQVQSTTYEDLKINKFNKLHNSLHINQVEVNLNTLTDMIVSINK